MPIASAKLIQSSDPLSDYNVICEPKNSFTIGANGLLTSDNVSAIVSGGVGPFTYQWDYDSGDVRIQALSPTNDVTQFNASGTNESISAIYKITVTDTGNGNLETEGNCTIRFSFGREL